MYYKLNRIIVPNVHNFMILHVLWNLFFKFLPYTIYVKKYGNVAYIYISLFLLSNNYLINTLKENNTQMGTELETRRKQKLFLYI